MLDDVVGRVRTPSSSVARRCGNGRLPGGMEIRGRVTLIPDAGEYRVNRDGLLKGYIRRMLVLAEP